MRETEKSLRTYFIIAGVFILKRPMDAFPASWKLARWFPTLARLVLGACFMLAV